MTNTKAIEEANRHFTPKPQPASQADDQHQKVLENMARLRRERLEREAAEQ